MPILVKLIRSLALFIIIMSSLKSEIIDDIRICALRVSFKKDTLLSTTGDGSFLKENLGIDCGSYTIDPPPHDKNYFESQLLALNNYYRSVSYEKFGVNIEGSTVYPEGNYESFILPHNINFYNPYDSPEMQEKLITELFYDALSIADSSGVAFKNYDLIVVFHAGIGQDFSLPFLDPTPEDIPSTFIDQNMINEHFNVPFFEFGDSQVSKGLLLPETQNHLLFDVAESMFLDANEPCEYQYGLTGTFALMIGFSIGLPPLWNIETGESGIGVFGLMDQGSNNGRGIIPAPPNAWSRIHAGWEESFSVEYSDTVDLPSRSMNQILKASINDKEYFLIENRNNKVNGKFSLDSIRVLMSAGNDYPPYVNILIDSVGVIKDSNGVIISVPNYDIGLPASGLLIWHINEEIILSNIDNYSINKDLSNLGIDLEEADGAQDIGFESIFVFNDISSGYFGDLWFKGNTQYELANFEMEGIKPKFNHSTIPSTASTDGSQSFISIENISAAKDTMDFIIANFLVQNNFPDENAHILNVYDLNGDGSNEYIGGRDSLFVGSFFSENKNYFHNITEKDIDVTITKNDGFSQIHILERSDSNSYYYNYNYDINFPTVQTSQTIDSLVFPKVQNNVYQHISKADWETFSKRVFSDSFTFSIDISESGIQIDNFSKPFKRWNEYNFISISGIDVDNDSRLDVLAIDQDGFLHAFNHNLTLLSGFPTLEKFIPPILAGDIIGDGSAEIIGKSLDSSSIIILNNKGKQLYNISSKKEDQLVCLTTVNGHKSIVSKFVVYNLNLDNDFNSENSWSFEHGSQGNNRYLNLPANDSSFHSQKLLVRSYIYPNPIKENIGTLRVETYNAKSVNIKIYDLLGVLLKSFDKKLVGCCSQITEWMWDASSFEPGVYFAHVSVNGKDLIKNKIIKIAIL